MIKLVKYFFKFKNIFLPVIGVIIGGVLGGIVTAVTFLVLVLMFSKNSTLEKLLVLAVLTFLLADNFSGPFAFMQNFRFVILLATLPYLFKYNLTYKNNANYLLLFTVVSLFVTLLFSPLGISAMLRALGFWLVGLVLFKLVSLLYVKSPKKTLELLVMIFSLYFFINLILIFAPFLNSYLLGRFKGLAGNPNGLGLIAMFIIAILEIIKQRKQTGFSQKFFTRFKIILFVIIIMTGSRTALFSAFVFEVMSKLLYNKVLLLAALLLLALFYVTLELISLQSLVNMLALSDYLRFETIADASGRTNVWPVVWEEIKTSPWFGNGMQYDNYFIDEYAFNTFGESTSREWNGVWSSYLSLLLNVGFVGVFAYTYFWIKIYRKAYFKNLAVAFVSMCFLSGITESWMAASMNPFTPLVFLFWAIQSQPSPNYKKKL